MHDKLPTGFLGCVKGTHAVSSPLDQKKRNERSPKDSGEKSSDPNSAPEAAFEPGELLAPAVPGFWGSLSSLATGSHTVP